MHPHHLVFRRNSMVCALCNVGGYAADQRPASQSIATPSVMQMQANHNFNPNANFTFDSTTDSFRLTALTDLQAGSQVCISYGQLLDDGKLATQYGFCVSSDENPNPPPLADSNAKGPQLMSSESILDLEGLLWAAATVSEFALHIMPCAAVLVSVLHC